MEESKQSQDTANKLVDDLDANFAILQKIAAQRARHNSHSELVNSLYCSALEGNAEDFEALVRLAQEASSKVIELTRHQFDTACEIASSRQAWPCLIFRSEEANSAMVSLVERLNLGAASSHPLDVEKAFDRSNDIRIVAWSLLIITNELREVDELLRYKEALESALKAAKKVERKVPDENLSVIELQISNYDNRCTLIATRLLESVYALQVKIGIDAAMQADLPSSLFSEAGKLQKLTDETISYWTSFGWKILKLLTHKKPEKYPFLRNIGMYKADTYLKKLVKQEHGKVIPTEVDKLRASGRAQKSVESNIQSGVFERLKGVYPSVAASAKTR